MIGVEHQNTNFGIQRTQQDPTKCCEMSTALIAGNGKFVTALQIT